MGCRVYCENNQTRKGKALHVSSHPAVRSDAPKNKLATGTVNEPSMEGPKGQFNSHWHHTTMVQTVELNTVLY